MLPRFALAVLFAVIASVSAPRIAGGSRDLLAVGATVERVSDGARRTVLGVPEGAAREAYEDLLRSSAREALLQGTTVYAPAPAEPETDWRVIEVVYYGTGSRAGRAPVVFTAPPGTDLPGAARARAAARHLASLPSTVTAAAARVLLGTEDVAAYADALGILASISPDAAAAEARRAATDASLPPERRIAAVRALRTEALGGAAAFPEVFRALAADPDPQVKGAAK
jgi:hypothetical protein